MTVFCVALYYLPQINWTKEALEILGLVTGTTKSIEKKMEEMERFPKRDRSKTKLLPLITYTSATYPIPSKMKENIRKKSNILSQVIVK